ncbi:MAG: hypothetical protein JO101_11550 [Candidatus Eremiobacteraeota bacterium]|nr:hypothetical protein [Candidatus Eremiobacteraeota bacterium]MBV8355949.1 hypothetical protein [Candidatus Eremiobacteraeota bacterium]
MAVYQCPDCLGVHGEATEPAVGIFVRCETCLLELELSLESASVEFVPAEAA